jgi:two-component system, LuxR family, sensor kinase FixL
LIGELTELIALDTKTREVSYKLEFASDLPETCVDRAQIQQVVLNLVRNAVEALAESAGKRELVIRTLALTDGDAEIAVCDNGPGVLQSIVPRLFDPFCTTKPHGAGLGLAISRTIVRSHEGSLDYRPNAPAGACFVVRLPRVKQDQK